MLPSEFDQWFTYHMAQFTGAVAWLAKFPEVSRSPGDPSQKDVTNAWRNTLRDVELRHAKEATTLLSEGKETFPERGYDCHARTVRAVALKIAGVQKAKRRHQRMIDGNELVDCPLCNDTGFVRIYHPSLLKFFRNTFSPDDPPRREGDNAEVWMHYWLDFRYKLAVKNHEIKCESGVARCTCASGQVKTCGIAYDSEQHVLFRDGDPREAMNRLETLLAKRGGF